MISIDEELHYSGAAVQAARCSSGSGKRRGGHQTTS